MKKVISLVGALALAGAGLAAETETAAEKEARMAWWTNDRFGMFIHFGLYSLPARHEWVKSIEQRTNADYDRYLKWFDPDLFDARDWARQAKAAGMKYVVLTTKHHEGFCLFDSTFTQYKSTNTPFGRDIVKEFVEACRAEGLKVGFYYSLPDWHHPEFPVDRYHPQRPVKCGPWDQAGMEGPEEPWNKLNANRHMERYRDYLYGQVTELLTKYGKIDLIWFDFTMPGVRTKHPEDWQSEKLLALVRKLQPDIVINNRISEHGSDIMLGDFTTPEQELPTKWVEFGGKRVPWELCQTFSGSWGYHRDERTWKSPHQLLELLVSCVARGGNLILNVGPTGRGNFDYRAQDRLKAIGDWMALNERSVRGCTAAPAEFTAPKGTVLTYNPKTNRLYIHLLDYKPSAHGYFPLDFMDKIEYAQFLHDASEIKLQRTGVEEAPKGGFILPHQKPMVEVPVIECMLKIK